uniref:Uncharacterized protein n=1 Tax=Panagrolaimus sp. ES5 TaxID=591445 RepID=A0AC34G4M3_9BILA
MKGIFLIFCYFYLLFSTVIYAGVINRDENDPFSGIKNLVTESIHKIDSIEKAKEDSSILREKLIVLKKRAVGNNAIDKSNPIKYGVAKTVDKIVHSKEEANALAAIYHFKASEMVSKSFYGSFYQDLTLSSAIDETILSSAEEFGVYNEDDFAKIDEYIEKNFVKKNIFGAQNVISNEKDLRTTEDAKKAAIYLRHFIYVMEKRANGDFSKTFFENSGGVWNAFVRHILAAVFDPSINTKEMANLIVAFCRISAAKIVAKYPPQIAAFFTDMTLSHKDASLKISWN